VKAGMWKCSETISRNMLDTTTDVVGEVESSTRKLWITQEMINKMDKQKKWNKINNKRETN
jgi:hypothetical protein